MRHSSDWFVTAVKEEVQVSSFQVRQFLSLDDEREL